MGNSSWGGRLDGSNVDAVRRHVARPYSAQKDNLTNFYRTGHSLTNTLAFNKSFTGGCGAALGQRPGEQVDGAQLGAEPPDVQPRRAPSSPYKHLAMDARANYILEQAQNRPILADGAGNANFNVAFLPTSLDVRSLQPGTKAADGSELVYNTGNPYNTNPYFAADKFVNNTTRERLLSSVSARYTFDNGLFVQGRVGRDGYTDRFTSVTPSGTAYLPAGRIIETTTQFNGPQRRRAGGQNLQGGRRLHLHAQRGGQLPPHQGRGLPERRLRPGRVRGQHPRQRQE